MTFERGIMSAMTSDDSAALVAAPAKTSLRGVAPPLPSEPMPKTKMAVNSAPMSANQMNALAVEMLKNAIPMTTASAAPVLTPRMLGSAIGLRVTDCMSAPATPSAAPHMKLKIVRMTRSRTMSASYD